MGLTVDNWLKSPLLNTPIQPSGLFENKLTSLAYFYISSIPLKDYKANPNPDTRNMAKRKVSNKGKRIFTQAKRCYSAFTLEKCYESVTAREPKCLNVDLPNILHNYLIFWAEFFLALK